MSGPRPKEQRPARGFSLIEMAVLLVVVGLVASAVIPRIIKKTEQEVFRENKALARTIRDEIIGFAAEKCYLPADTNDLKQYRHLGDRMTGNLTFRPATELTQAGLAGQPLTKVTTTLRVNVNGATLGDPIAFVVASPGKNGKFEDRANIMSGNPVILKDYREDGANAFDDVIDFVTLQYLQSMTTGCSQTPLQEGTTTPPPPAPSVTLDQITSLGNWRTNPSVSIITGQSATGTGSYAGFTQKPTYYKKNQDTDSPNDVYYSPFIWGRPSDFSTSWALMNKYLSYDLQNKFSWGSNLQYGALGLSFRYQDLTPGNQSYGVSYMYYNDNDNDNIPRRLKPNYPNFKSQRVVVLWKQLMNGTKTNWEMLAYKNIQNQYQMRGQQWWGDGRGINDDTPLMVRLRERLISGTKTNDIQVFVADASVKYGPARGSYNSSFPCNHTPRTGDSIATNNATTGLTRQVYYPAGVYGTGGIDPCMTSTPSPVPSWAPNETVGASSYYSLYAGAWAYPPHDYYTLLTGWTMNSAVSGTPPALLSDGATIRDSSLTTPSSGVFPTQEYEVGLHIFGQTDNAGQGLYFKDFAYRFRSWTP